MSEPAKQEPRVLEQLRLQSDFLNYPYAYVSEDGVGGKRVRSGHVFLTHKVGFLAPLTTSSLVHFRLSQDCALVDEITSQPVSVELGEVSGKLHELGAIVSIERVRSGIDTYSKLPLFRLAYDTGKIEEVWTEVCFCAVGENLDHDPVRLFYTTFVKEVEDGGV